DLLLIVDCLPLSDDNTLSAHDADRSPDAADTAAVVMAELRAEDLLWDFLDGQIALGWRVWSVGEDLLGVHWRMKVA
ncbi:hypothetical protein BJY52DRAFT_1128804, partial [Lactarius psammicola]